MKLCMLGKQKPNFVIDSIATEVNIDWLKRVIEKFFRNYLTPTIALMVTVVLMMGIL